MAVWFLFAAVWFLPFSRMVSICTLMLLLACNYTAHGRMVSFPRNRRHERGVVLGGNLVFRLREVLALKAQAVGRGPSAPPFARPLYQSEIDQIPQPVVRGAPLQGTKFLECLVSRAGTIAVLVGVLGDAVE